MKALKILLAFAFLGQSCATIKNSPKYQLSDGNYEFRQADSKYKMVFVETIEDTIKIYPILGESTISMIPGQDEYFRTKHFDVDVMTIGFKYRPAVKQMPKQLNTNFNGNVYLGYRVDRFFIDYEKTKRGLKKTFRHRGFTAGVFGGLGATAINPWTTNYRITDEYDGFILSRGISAMIGLNTLTVGVGVGWDYLTDRDKNVWIYQNKPWIGLTIGLNLN